jgi:hypothetical protein
MCGANRLASRPYRPGRLDWSTSQVSRSAPLGFVASGIELRMMPVEMRFCSGVRHGSTQSLAHAHEQRAGLNR